MILMAPLLLLPSVSPYPLHLSPHPVVVPATLAHLGTLMPMVLLLLLLYHLYPVAFPEALAAKKIRFLRDANSFLASSVAQ